MPQAPTVVEPTSTQPAPGVVGKSLAVAGVLVSVVFLLNPTLGLFEVPDNLPIVGNLDEVFFSGLLFACLAKLGINILPWLRTVRR